MALNKNAKKWVAALRSRKYKQTTGRLKDVSTNRFCCLGVACELAVRAGVIPSDDDGDYAGQYGTLPLAVQDWLGLASKRGDFDKQGEVADLTELNDERGFKFYQIARIIESEPKGLFRGKK
jgi:hypothetical protein